MIVGSSEVIGLVEDAKGSWANFVKIEKYPSGEPLIKTVSDKSTKYFPTSATIKILLRPKSMDAFMATMFLVDANTERGYPIPHLIFPFALGARQDRLNPSGDMLFTAKSIAKEINMRNFPSVTVVDCHSEVLPALIDRCRNVHLESFIDPSKIFNILNDGKDIRRKYDGVISPDAGADKRATAVAQKLGVPLYHGWKKRDVTTGALTGFGVETLPVYTKNGCPQFLIVDDICDGGGTFIGLAKHIKEYIVANCNIDLLVTHGLFSKGVADLRAFFNTIYTTDSIIRDNDISFVKQFDICEPLLRGNL